LIKYSVFDLICNTISCCVWSCNTGKINVYGKTWLYCDTHNTKLAFKWS